jgi:hypothetical protein
VRVEGTLMSSHWFLVTGSLWILSPFLALALPFLILKGDYLHFY